MSTKHRLFGLLLGLLMPLVAWSATYDVVKIQNKRTPSHYFVVKGGTVQHLADTKDAMSQWIIHEVQGGVTLQNVGTGLFMGPLGRNKETKVTTDAAVFTMTKDGNFTIFENSEMQANASGGNSNVIGWSPVDDGSLWKVIEAGTLNGDEWADVIDKNNGTAQPQAGMYCRVLAPAYSAYMTEDYGAMNLNCQAFITDSPYRQLWQLVDAGNGNVKLQNVYTGHYVKPVTGASQRVLTSASEDQAGTFAITVSPKAVVPRYYVIGTAGGSGYNKLHCDAGKSVVGWEAGSWGGINGSEWQFVPVELTEQEIADARADFDAKNGIVQNVAVYQEVLDQLFLDKACTQLNPEAHYDALKAQLPEILQKMADKIKDDAWKTYKSGTNWEKQFRIAPYHIYSKHDQMCWEVGMSNAFGRLSNPTGVFCEAGTVMAIMVDQDVPKNATLKIEVVAVDQESTGNQFELKKGLNFINVDKKSTLYVFYEMTGVGNSSAYYYENFPEITVHIEGGEVSGYWDRTRGMTDKEWNDMLADGLLQYDRIAMKDDLIVMLMNGSLVKKYVGDKVERLVKIWNDIIALQNELMGINDTYIPNISKRCNNIFTAISITYNYMFAGSYGTYYNETTLSEILSYDKMKKTGAIWGPAHEIGHNHQNLITPAGTMEVSNNFFSNVQCYVQGAITSRGPGMNSTWNTTTGLPYYVANKKPWIEYDIWQKTQMYWKLYQYFHIAGHDTQFYQKVFNRLRADGLSRRANCQLNADVDYLKFAVTCCDVAQMDLSEFFECYGMFLPMDETTHTVGGNTFQAYHVGDYADYYLHTSQAMIDAAKKSMMAWRTKGKKKQLKNLMFIDDRIKPSLATYEGHKEGEVRTAISDEWPIGSFGDCDCQYTDYAPENQKYADGYTYSLSGKTFQASKGGKGAAGFKFYDAKNNLIYLSAFNKVVLPQNVYDAIYSGGGYVVAAQVDGTDVEMSRVGKHEYVVKTYRGSKDAVATSYVNAKIAPALQPNWIAQVEAVEGSAAYNYASNTNVMADGTIAKLVVTDNTPIYIPGETASVTRANFSRSQAKGWSTLALPFDFKVSGLGTGVTAYMYEETTEADGEPVVNFYPVGGETTVRAGQPLLINCTKSSISMTLNDTQASTEDWDPGYDCDCMLGYNDEAPGCFDINPDGSAFDQEGIKPLHAGFMKSYKVGLLPDGITVVNNDLDPEAMYSLSGIRLTAPRQGEPYIKAGRVYIK